MLLTDHMEMATAIMAAVMATVTAVTTGIREVHVLGDNIVVLKEKWLSTGIA